MYRCRACNHEFEAIQRIHDDPLKVCSACGCEAVERIISVSAFHLAGSGWAADGYSKPEKKKD
jgi:putative FmdB family regulatory protein